MAKSRALVSQSDSLKKKKLKLKVDEITSEQVERTEEMNGKKKKKRTKKTEADDEVCEHTENISDENIQMIQSTQKKKKKRKAEVLETRTHLNGSQEENLRKKKKKSEPSGDVKDENGLDGEEKLSPEEKRVLERKLKKILKKEGKKPVKEEDKSIKPEQNQRSVAEEAALEYLKCWSEKREEWKFKKVRQTWLLNNMYDSEKVSDNDFEVLLLYVDSLRGMARESTLKKAEVIMCWEGEEINSADAEKKRLRAKQVVQML